MFPHYSKTKRTASILPVNAPFSPFCLSLNQEQMSRAPQTVEEIIKTGDKKYRVVIPVLHYTVSQIAPLLSLFIV